MSLIKFASNRVSALVFPDGYHCPVKHLEPLSHSIVGAHRNRGLNRVIPGFRKLTFRLSARDAAGPVGEGTHQRVVIQEERFLDKAKNKGTLV